MDEVQFENWKQFITETLADVATRQQAAEKRMEAAERRMNAADRRMDRFERNLVRLARLGQRARSGLTARQKQHEANMARIELTLAEIGDKLNGLIGHVQGQNPAQ